MRRIWLFLVYGIIAVVLESTWLAYFPTTLIRFDLILMAVIAIALADDQRGAIASVVIMGALLDVTSMAPFGLAVFSLVVVYGFIRTIVAKISIEIWLARFVWVGLASLLNKVITVLLVFVWSGNLSFVEVLGKICGPQALFDAAVGLFMIPLLRRLDSLTWEKLFRPKGLVLE